MAKENISKSIDLKSIKKVLKRLTSRDFIMKTVVIVSSLALLASSILPFLAS